MFKEMYVRKRCTTDAGNAPVKEKNDSEGVQDEDVKLVFIQRCEEQIQNYLKTEPQEGK
jgi:hypothetical protein